MSVLFASLLVLVPRPVPVVEAVLSQVSPAVREERFVRDKDRAVVLVHGLALHPFNKARLLEAELRVWQRPNSLFVSRLAPASDVYAFAYSQTATVDAIANATNLADRLADLKKLGYKEIVLIGHSAGGLIARQLVEDHPALGVTRVLQVCAPNEGSTWATVGKVRGKHAEFLTSLTRSARRDALLLRAEKRLPPAVEFACVVGTRGVSSDGIVSLSSQWPDDLQRQGVPAHTIDVTHWDAVRAERAVRVLADLATAPSLRRWPAWRVEDARTALLRR